MKYYGKFLAVGFICSFVCFLTLNVVSLSVGDVVLILSFNEVYYYPAYITTFLYWYFPFLLFQIVWGTYIYSHFCSASIYFFSRCENRIQWFLIESLKLIGYVILFLILRLAGGLLAVAMQGKLCLDGTESIALFYYFSIQILFLFSATMGISLLSIIFSSNTGFAVVQGIQTLFIAIFFLTEQLLFKNEAWKERDNLLFSLNPIAHLIIKVQKSDIFELNQKIAWIESFDLNSSVLIYFLGAAGTVLSGCFIIKKYDFIIQKDE